MRDDVGGAHNLEPVLAAQINCHLHTMANCHQRVVCNDSNQLSSTSTPHKPFRWAMGGHMPSRGARGPWTRP